jgi:hypothetical protein
MQRPPHLDLFPPAHHPRYSPSPAPLPTPPTETTTAPGAHSHPTFAKPHSAQMSPTTRYGVHHRRVYRSSFSTSASSDEGKYFVLDDDAHPTKYMPYWDDLENKYDLPRPNQSEHQVKQDPTGTLKSIPPPPFFHPRHC